jgi:hypothetical protein
MFWQARKGMVKGLMVRAHIRCWAETFVGDISVTYATRKHMYQVWNANPKTMAFVIMSQNSCQ